MPPSVCKYAEQKEQNDANNKQLGSATGDRPPCHYLITSTLD